MMQRYVVGIDEVGRGALAGPVVVAVAMIPAGRFCSLKDSKKLTSSQREAWSVYFKNCGEVDYAVARVYPRGIERLNISQAANRAALKAFMRLCKKRGIDPGRTRVFLDGGLFLGSRKEQVRNMPRAATVIKGDETISAVAAASIIAKVERDRFMVKLAKRYPEYSFETHKGYGTKKHMEAIVKIGPCDVHRLTFLKKSLIIRG